MHHCTHSGDDRYRHLSLFSKVRGVCYQRRHKNCTPAVSEHLRKGDMDGNRHLHKWQCLFCERQFWTLGKWCRMLKVLPNGMKNNSAKYECSGRCNNCYWGWSARKCFSRVIKLLDCSAKNMILKKKVSFLIIRNSKKMQLPLRRYLLI